MSVGGGTCLGTMRAVGEVARLAIVDFLGILAGEVGNLDLEMR